MLYLRDDEMFRRNDDYHHKNDRLFTNGVVAFRWIPGIIIFQDKNQNQCPAPCGDFLFLAQGGL
jgi:hypothetical protein